MLPEDLADGRIHPEGHDLGVGQLVCGHQEVYRPTVDNDVQRGGGSPVRRRPGTTGDLDAADGLPGPETLVSGLLGIGQRQPTALDSEIERSQRLALVPGPSFDYPDVLDIHAERTSPAITASSPLNGPPMMRSDRRAGNFSPSTQLPNHASSTRYTSGIGSCGGPCRPWRALYSQRGGATPQVPADVADEVGRKAPLHENPEAVSAVEPIAITP